MSKTGYKTLSGKYLLGYTNLKKGLLYFDKIIYDKDDIEQTLRLFGNDWVNSNTNEVSKKAILKNPENKIIIDSQLANLEFLKSKGLIEEINSLDFVSKEREDRAKKGG